MIGDDDFITSLLDQLDKAYILLLEAQSNGPLHSGIRRQWFTDKEEWIKSTELLMYKNIEGWTPPWTPYDAN